jgi:hypothetical protein
VWLLAWSGALSQAVIHQGSSASRKRHIPRMLLPEYFMQVYPVVPFE